MTTKIPLPPPPRQLAMEIERYQRRMKEPGLKQSEMNQLHIDVVQRTEHYHLATGEGYKKIVDVKLTEKNAVKDLFLTLRGHSWSRKFGWIGQNKTLTKPEIKVFEAAVPLYDGISVSLLANGINSVYGVDLGGYGCCGNLTSKISDLQQCQTLFMELNEISGPLPNSIGELVNLEYLNLSGNNLEGPLQRRMILNFVKLRQFDLSFNSLSGSIPDAFQNVTKLAELNLSGNNFSGTFPPSISCLLNLKILKIYSNNLEDELPVWMNQLTHLTDLNLSRNR